MAAITRAGLSCSRASSMACWMCQPLEALRHPVGSHPAFQHSCADCGTDCVLSPLKTAKGSIGIDACCLAWDTCTSFFHGLRQPEYEHMARGSAFPREGRTSPSSWDHPRRGLHQH